MSSSVSRRLTVTLQQSHDESIRAQLFAIFAGYGLVEAFSCENSANYDESVITVQFQRLSSAEQLQADAVRSGRPWHVAFQPAVPHTSGELLLSSRRPPDAAGLRAMAAALGLVPAADVEGSAADRPPPPSTSTAAPSRTPKGSTGLFEEKLLRAPGRGAGAARSIAASKDDDAWAAFATRNVTVVQNYCVGPYACVLRFADAHGANTFLAAHQLELAKQHETYAQFVPAAPPPQQQQQQQHPRGSGTAAGRVAAPAPMRAALHALLTCQPASQLREGDTLRGFIVEVRSTALCVVDAGAVDDASPHRPTLMVETHTNFLKAGLRDEVLVQLRTIVPASRTVQATLLHVLGVDHATVGNTRLTGGKQQRPQQEQQQTSALPSSQPFMTRSRSGAHGATPTSSQDSLALSQSQSQSQSSTAPLSQPTATRKLASRLFQAIQQRKQDGTLLGGGGGGGAAERISSFPPGLGPLSLLLVRVDRVEVEGPHPGLHATALGTTTDAVDALPADGGGWPVHVPAALVPAAEGGDWTRFVLPGERMTVALLYTVAVGDSRATLRGVASKLEADVRRASTLAASLSRRRGGGGPGAAAQRDAAPRLIGDPDDDDALETAEGVPTLMVGDAMTATPVRLVEAGEVGSGGPRNPFPAWIVLPSGDRRVELLCVLPTAQAPAALAASVALRAAPPLELVVAEVVKGAGCGHYALVMDAAAYRAAEESRRRAVCEQQQASREAVRRKLAAVLGEDAVRNISTGSDESHKRPREE